MPTQREADLVHANAFYNRLCEAEKAWHEGGDTAAQALMTFDFEWENIRRAQAWCANNLEHDEDARLLCAKFPNGASDLLAIRLPASERIRWRNAGLKCAIRLNVPILVGFHLSNLVIAHHDTGECEKAVEYAHQALHIFREQNLREHEASTLINLGNVYSTLARRVEANDCFRRSLAIFEETGNQTGQAHNLNNLGLSAEDHGKYEEAISLYERSLEIYRSQGDLVGACRAVGNLGSAHFQSGQYQEARDIFANQLVLARQIGDTRSEANALRDIGTVLNRQNEPEQALPYLEAACTIYKDIGNPRGHSMALDGIGRAYSLLDDEEAAISSFREAIETADRIGYRRGVALPTMHIGFSLERLGKIDEAIAQLEIALGLYEEIEHPSTEGLRDQLARVKATRNTEAEPDRPESRSMR